MCATLWNCRFSTMISNTIVLQLLSKMAPLIGKDIVEKLFLERFALLCLDPLFHVRKVCAANFGDFSSVVGSESTEAVLLRKFFRYEPQLKMSRESNVLTV